MLHLDPIVLTEQQETSCKMIIVEGNKVWQRWALYYPPSCRKEDGISRRKFRNAILRGDKNPGGKIPQNKLHLFHKELPKVLEIRSKQSFLEFNGQQLTVEEALLRAYVKWLAKNAWQAARNYTNCGLQESDFESEAMLCALNAIYGFLKPEMAFSTFVTACFRNRLRRILLENYGLSIDRKVGSLLGRIQAYKRKQSEHVTFDEICIALELTPKEIQRVSAAKHQIIFEHQIDGLTNGDLEDHRLEDYTALGKQVEDESSSEQQCQIDIETLIEKSGLKGMEREVFIASVHGGRGWKSEYARNNINPNTGKPYTRMRITQVHRKAQNKVAKVYESELYSKNLKMAG